MRTDSAVPVGEVSHQAATSTTALLCVAAFVTMLDLFIVNVAFESIAETYSGSSLAALSWVLNGYIIVYAAALIPAGSLADWCGRKKAFLGGLGLFTVASVGCAAAPSLGVLIACRVAQAIGAAVLMPASLGLILSVLPEARRPGAVRVWAITSSFAGALGPVVGGLLAETSWRWAFLLNLPIGLGAIVVAARLLPTAPHSAPARVPDSLGGVMIAIAVGAPSLGLVMAEEWGWNSARIWLTALTAVVALTLLTRRVLTHPSPVVPLRLLRLPGFVAANITILIFTSAFSAVFLSVSLWLGTVADYGPLRAGAALIPGPLAVPLFAALTQRGARRVPPRLVVSSGLLIFGLGSVLLATQGGAHYATDILPGWVTIGVGIGVAMPTLIGAATADLAPADAATGSAVVNTARQAGYALGIAGLVAILGSRTALDSGSTFQDGWIFVTALVLASAAAALGVQPQKTSLLEEELRTR